MKNKFSTICIFLIAAFLCGIIAVKYCKTSVFMEIFKHKEHTRNASISNHNRVRNFIDENKVIIESKKKKDKLVDTTESLVEKQHIGLLSKKLEQLRAKENRTYKEKLNRLTRILGLDEWQKENAAKILGDENEYNIRKQEMIYNSSGSLSDARDYIDRYKKYVGERPNTKQRMKEIFYDDLQWELYRDEEKKERQQRVYKSKLSRSKDIDSVLNLDIQTFDKVNKALLGGETQVTREEMDQISKETGALRSSLDHYYYVKQAILNKELSLLEEILNVDQINIYREERMKRLDQQYERLSQ